MTRIITPDEFRGVLNHIGVPDKIKLYYIRGGKYDYQFLHGHLDALVGPGYVDERSIQSSLVVRRERGRKPCFCYGVL